MAGKEREGGGRHPTEAWTLMDWPTGARDMDGPESGWLSLEEVSYS